MIEAGEDEAVLWRGSSSQLTNIWHYVICLVLAGGAAAGGIFFPPAFALLAVPVLWALWRYLVVRCRVYELTSQRLRLYEGVLNRKIDDLELYRVKDTVIEQPFWLRIFGLGTVRLETSDRSHPSVAVPAVRDALGLREKIRARVETLRDRKRVREVDFEGAEDDGGAIDLI